MNDDVNVSGATAAIFTAIRSGNTLLSQLADRADSETAKAEVREALLAVRAMLDTLGLDPLAEPWVSAGAAGGAADGTAESPEHAALEALIAEQLNARAEARKAKDFAKADQIRDALTEAGIAIEDGPQGSTWSLSSRFKPINQSNTKSTSTMCRRLLSSFSSERLHSMRSATSMVSPMPLRYTSTV